MSDEKKPDDGGEVLVFRNPGTGAPVAVPPDVAEAAERPYRAYQLRLAGKSWQEVAAEEQYPTPAAAQYEVKRYIEEGAAMISDMTRRQMLQLEIARLDALQAAVWPKAMQGVLPAVSSALNLVVTRVKLLSLDIPSAEEGLGGPRTVVVPADDDGYRKALEQVMNNDG